jgi:endonuclease/exonuclease/phosphatase family metal-dependent hydrolase
MATILRVVTWNIAEGRYPEQPDNGTLSALAYHIWSRSPDLVLLNEAKNYTSPFGGGINQVVKLGEMTGMPYVHWGNTVQTGLTGYKAVGVLSKFPLGAAVMHPVMRDGSATAFGTLETSIQVDGMKHRILSTRFAPHNSPDHEIENRLGIEQAITLVRQFPTGDPVIFGGDFNSRPGSPEMVGFLANSGLRDSYRESPDSGICGDAESRIDFIFFRGPYNVRWATQRCEWPPTAPPSDHPILTTELESTLPPEHPDCASIRIQISTTTQEINDLIESKEGLNPRDPADRQEINQINAQIATLNTQLTALRDRAAALGCR